MQGFPVCLFLVLTFTVNAAFGDDCNGPENTLPIFDKDLTFVKSTANGHLYQANAQTDNVLQVAHVYGSAYNMGKAQAELFGDEIVNTITEFYAYLESQIDQYIHRVPENLRKIIEKDGINAALQLTADLTKPYTPQHFIDEAQGIADGLAGKITFDDVYRLNMFPEVIKASCSMLGAWGEAIAATNGSLYQLRALDFGIDSPLVNHTILIVYHPAEGHPFLSVTWTGLIGSVTSYGGFVGVSEKVWLHYNETASRAGIPFHFLIRDIAQFDITKDDAINRMINNKRTCSVFLGVGDNYTDTFRVCEYSHEELFVYDDRNYPAYPEHPLLKGLVYVDKHTQPSHDPCLGSLMQKYYGQIDPETVLRKVVAPFGTGDLHAAIYDYKYQIMYVSIAGLKIDANLQPVQGPPAPAFSRPWFKFNAGELMNLPLTTED